MQHQNNPIIPIDVLANVVMKIKQLKDLTPEEEVIYLMYYEEMDEEQAKMIAYGEYKDSSN